MKNFLLFSLLLLLICCANSKAQTYVNSNITTSTTWTKANSPYIISDTVWVVNSVSPITLTIEAGVEVRFDSIAILTFEDASLIAVGTAVDSINFTNNTGSQNPGSWHGITYHSGLSNSPIQLLKISYCNFRFSNIDIVADVFQGSPIENIIVNNSAFSSNNRGIAVISSMPIAGITQINACSFANNTLCGIQLNTPVDINNCIFFHNYFGILANGSDYEIKNCLIQNSTSAGIQLVASSSKIADCTLKNNHNSIVDLLGSNTIQHCLIDSSTQNAIVFGGSQGSTDTISECIITHNATGIEDGSSGGTITFFNNILQYNSTGILSDNTNSIIYCNKICNNSLYNFLYSSSGNCNISNNYWCTTSLTTIDSLIEDGNDNSSLGIANYLPIDSTQCYLSGCNLVHSAAVTNASCALCADGSATVNVLNGFAPYTYTWGTAPVQTSATATGLTTGTYVVSITDQFGCTATENIVVNAGSCNAQFNLVPDTLPQHYLAINMASGAAPLTYSWNWGDGSPNDATPFPSHTYAVAGYYTICLTIADANGCTNTYCNSYYLQKTNAIIYVSVVPPTPTGIAEYSGNSSFSIYPNPARDLISIIAANPISNADFTIYDLAGNIVLTKRITAQKTMLDVSTATNGIYILELRSGSSVARQKLVIEHMH